MSRKILFITLTVYLIFVSLPPSSFAQHGGGTVVTELYCVAKNNAEDAALQSALDWACGAGGADCSKIQQGGPCYDPTDIQKTASFAFNDYYLNHGLTDDACSFSNTAALTSLNPSYDNCKFPSRTVNNASISQSTVTSGMGSDSADLSSSYRFAYSWLSPLIVAPLFLFQKCYKPICKEYPYASATTIQGSQVECSTPSRSSVL